MHGTAEIYRPEPSEPHLWFILAVQSGLTPTPIQSHSDEGAGFPDALVLLMGDAPESHDCFDFFVVREQGCP